MAVVTISRQYGSGGTEIAARVCEMLGYRYLDKVLITQVAAEAGLSGRKLVEFSEQRSEVRDFLDRLLRPGPHGCCRVARERDSGPVADTRGVLLPVFRSGHRLRVQLHLQGQSLCR